MKNILLVDDDQTMRSLLKTLLELEGYQVASVGEASEDDILKKISDQMPDLLLLDMYIRKVSGISILQKVRKDSALQNIKVIMSSGMDVKEQCMKAGSNGFLLKPYMPDDLLGLIHSILP